MTRTKTSNQGGFAVRDGAKEKQSAVGMHVRTAAIKTSDSADMEECILKSGRPAESAVFACEDIQPSFELA